MAHREGSLMVGHPLFNIAWDPKSTIVFRDTLEGVVKDKVFDVTGN